MAISLNLQECSLVVVVPEQQDLLKRQVAWEDLVYVL